MGHAQKGRRIVDLQTGDIILSAKGSIITRFMRLFQKDPVFWGHCLLVKDNETAWEAHYILKETKIEDAFKRSKHLKIIRNKYLSEDQKAIMRKVAPKLLGYPYGVGRIALQLLDHIFHTNWFTSKADCKYIQVCSSYVAWIYWVACRHQFNGVPWQSCDPDDIEDDQITFNPHLYNVIEERGI